MSQQIAADPPLARGSLREQLRGFGLVGSAAFAIIMLVSLSLAPIGGLLIVLWALGTKALDASFITLALVLGAVVATLAEPFIKEQFRA